MDLGALPTPIEVAALSGADPDRALVDLETARSWGVGPSSATLLVPSSATPSSSPNPPQRELLTTHG